MDTKEIELTFLARKLPPQLEGIQGMEMIDCYFPGSAISIHPRLRARKSGDNYSLTKKLQVDTGNASQHFERTIPLNKEEFDFLAHSTDRKLIKTRYNTVIEENKAEVDVFRGGLTGLVLIDFEFSSEEDLKRFVVPRICLANVTQEPFIAGGILAGKNYSDIENHLLKFNYQAINPLR